MRARMMWMVVLAVAIITAACGDSKSSFLPTAPSALPTSVANVDASTADAGYSTTGNGNGNGRRPGVSLDSAGRVIVEGLINAKGDNTILVSGQVITVTSATVIRHGDVIFPFAELQEQDRVHVTANRVGSGLEAIEIKRQNFGDGDVTEPPPADPLQVVTVMALDANAFERGGENSGADPGSFQLTRTGTQAQLDASLDVAFTIGGSASAGDYQPINLTATFQPSESTATVVVMPISDTIGDAQETVELTLSAGEGYAVGTPDVATVVIGEMAPPTVSVKAKVEQVLEGTSNSMVLEVTRTGDLSVGMSVTMQFSGTAKFGVDYGVSPSPGSAQFTLPFGPNQAVWLFSINVVADGISEPEETIVFSALPGTGYQPGSSGILKIPAQQ